MSNTTDLQQDALQILNAAPDNYLVLLPDAPRFTIVGVTEPPSLLPLPHL